MRNNNLLLIAAVVFGIATGFKGKYDVPEEDNGKKLATVNFVRVSGPANSTSRTDYQYRPKNVYYAGSSSICQAD